MEFDEYDYLEKSVYEAKDEKSKDNDIPSEKGHRRSRRESRDKDDEREEDRGDERKSSRKPREGDENGGGERKRERDEDRDSRRMKSSSGHRSGRDGDRHRERREKESDRGEKDGDRPRERREKESDRVEKDRDSEKREKDRDSEKREKDRDSEKRERRKERERSKERDRSRRSSSRTRIEREELLKEAEPELETRCISIPIPMASHSDKSSKRRKKMRVDDTPATSSSSSPPSSSDSSSSDGEDAGKRSRRRRKHRSRHRSRERSSSRRYREEKREKRRKHRRREKKKVSESESGSGSESERVRDKPEDVIRFILNEFSGVSADLEQLLQMIDDGQAVDISGLSEKSLVKHLRKLFLSLNLKESRELVFLLPSHVSPTLKVVGSILHPNTEPPVQKIDSFAPEIDVQEVPLDVNSRHMPEDFNMKLPSPRQDVAGPKKRVMGPEMPSAELLAAAAKLTEAEAELRDAEMDGGDGGFFIGPPPPAVVKEAESANEAERFEEVTRIMGAEVDSPYDVVGVNRNMTAENIKKRYWKLSLMVHPDKCPHPQANQAFIILNKAFKDLQDPDKRKAMDDKIIQKEEQERFKVELKEMREAAHWRRLQGISMEGDEALLADMDTKVEKKRDEWMTTLPPERKPGVTTQSTKFNRNTKEGRGDTSAWTDTPLERAERAKMNYLEAYNTATALASNDQQNQNTNMDAEMVDKYNKAKRSKSLVEKHLETAGKRSKKKSKQESSSKDEWEGQHPWKPWDREKDLTAGRQNVKLDAENMSQGLSSRFSSGSFQRNFL